jgi:predicted phage terminase large subunit-like protein
MTKRPSRADAWAKAAEASAARVEVEAPTPAEVPHGLADLPLLDLIPRLTPHHRRPTHLATWCELIERASNEPIRALCSIPIRHFKTESTVHGIVYLLLRHPTWRIIFLTHSAEAANKWGKRIRQIAEATPIGPSKNWSTIAEWRNEVGGGVVVMSADQSRIGYDCDALIADDPLDEHGANDPKVRESVDEAISLYTARCMKDGKRGPVLIVASRFHPDDPIGRRTQRTAVEWHYVCHSALIDEGLATERSFAPDVWPLDELKATRAELAERDPSERIWWAQFQNVPKPIGTDLFREPARYARLPEWSFRLAYGADLAFTAGATSDYFAMVAAKIMGTTIYILEVQRHKLDAHLIESTAKSMIARWGGHGDDQVTGAIYSYMSGPEVGLARLMRERGLPFIILPARYNKLVRAQKTIKRWNDGLIQVPTSGPWVKGFLHRVACFRGNDHDEGDDEVDALVSLVDGSGGGAAGGRPRTLGKSYAGGISGPR